VPTTVTRCTIAKRYTPPRFEATRFRGMGGAERRGTALIASDCPQVVDNPDRLSTGACCRCRGGERSGTVEVRTRRRVPRESGEAAGGALHKQRDNEDGEK
jgi:hypothetical protein